MDGNIFGIGFFLVLLALAYGIGKWIETRHYASIRAREKEMQSLLIIPVRTPQIDQPCRTEFVSGSVVISSDYFKMVYAGILKVIGGRMRPFESLVERARREAILRMKEEAKVLNGQYIFNVKFSTANLFQGNNNNGSCVEVIAYGTAVIPNKTSGF